MTSESAFLPMPEDDRRAKLRQVFDLLAELDTGLPLTGFDDESAAIEGCAESLKVSFGKDFIATCEGCSANLFVGDQGHRCLDGELLCKDCTPTWADVKQQWEEGRDDDGDEDRASFMSRYAKHISGGGKPDDLMLYTL